MLINNYFNIWIIITIINKISGEYIFISFIIHTLYVDLVSVRSIYYSSILHRLLIDRYKYSNQFLSCRIRFEI
jgi:hypothetical protein